MPDVKEVVNGLEMSYKYSNVDENNTLVPQWIVLHALALLKAQERCSDVVSREEVLKEQYEVHIPEYGIVYAVPVEYIKSLKPIAPQTPEPRLLELDEIKMLGLMWLESRNGFVQPVICQNYEYGVDKYVGFIMVHGTICNSINTFGKLWRVWTSEPSKEQREAMRWWNE